MVNGNRPLTFGLKSSSCEFFCKIEMLKEVILQIIILYPLLQNFKLLALFFVCYLAKVRKQISIKFGECWNK